MKKDGLSDDYYEHSINQFIWSACEDYLRQNGDCLIVYAPAIYFKSLHIFEKSNLLNFKFDEGFGFNRKHFHASKALITCIKWNFVQSFHHNELEFPLKLYEIDDKNKCVEENPEEIIIKKTYTSPKQYFEDCKKEAVDDAFACLLNNGRNPKTGMGILYSIVDKKNRNNEVCLNKKNYYNMLPIYVAQLAFDKNKWFYNENIIRTFDKKYEYLKNHELLRRCFVFTCLYRNNHMETKIDKNNKLIPNQLCFDINTIASEKIKILKNDLDSYDRDLINCWKELLQEAKKTINYKANYKYGHYQISKQLDTFELIQKGIKTKKKYHYPKLHNLSTILHKKLNKYYENFIEPLLFQYELIK